MDLIELVGQKVRKLRNEKKLSLMQLSKISGLSPSQIWALEKGSSNATMRTLYKVSVALGVTIEYLISDKELYEDASEKILLRKIHQLDDTDKSRIKKIIDIFIIHGW